MKEIVKNLRVAYDLSEVRVTHDLGIGLLELATHHDVGGNGYRKITTIVVTSPWYKNDGTEKK